MALQARQLADSWRNYNVGVATISLYPERSDFKNLWVVRYAANTKPTQHASKYCGELYNFDSLIESKVEHILGIFVVGEPNADHGSGRKDLMVTPCELCRGRMRSMLGEKKPVIRTDTLVVSANCHWPWLRKHHTVETLFKSHREHFEHE